VKANLLVFHSLFIYICIAVGDLVIKRVWLEGIPLNGLVLYIYFAWPKLGPGFSTSYDMWLRLRWTVIVRFVYIGGIDYSPLTRNICPKINTRVISLCDLLLVLLWIYQEILFTWHYTTPSQLIPFVQSVPIASNTNKILAFLTIKYAFCNYFDFYERWKQVIVVGLWFHCKIIHTSYHKLFCLHILDDKIMSYISA
jgi:hypothetical protein